MKKRTVVLIAFLVLGMCQVLAQSPIIFRPGPGLNDGTDQGGIAGGKDAFVYQGATTTNYGDDPQLVALPISDCNATHFVGYIQFDLTSLPAVVDSVFVVFKHYPETSYCYSGCNADFYFARVLAPWNEMTINYDNQPAHDTAFYGPVNISFPNDFGERAYNITSAYNLWKSGTVQNYGMAIYSTTITCNNAAISFDVHSSDDTANRPYLKIYSHPATSPACLNWRVAGTAGFSAGEVAYTSIAVNGSNVPYAAFSDFENGSRLSVLKFNGTDWVNVGTAGFSAGPVYYSSIAIDAVGTPYVAYSDGSASNRAYVQKFNGTAWEPVGAALSTEAADNISIAIDGSGTPFVAFVDYARGLKATVVKYDGTSWTTVGIPGFSAGATRYTSLALYGSTPYVAYSDLDNGSKATTMKFDGTTWTTVGSAGFSAGEADFTSLKIDGTGTPYVAYSDYGNAQKTTVMKYDGSSWVSVGTPGFSAGQSNWTSIAIDASGAPHVAYMDYPLSNRATVKKFDGSNWLTIGSAGFSAGPSNYTALAIDASGIPYVAYEDYANAYKVTVQRLVTTPLSPITGPANVCIGSSATLADDVPGGAWSSSSGVAAIGSSGMVTGVSAGTATITYAVSSDCRATLEVTVNPLPAISAGSDVSICTGSGAALTATGATSYSWSPSAGLSCTTCDAPYASPTVTTTYTVTGSSALALIYNQEFIHGEVPVVQCNAWTNFRATLLSTYTYTGFTIRGSADPVGITCTDPAIATAVANALRTGIDYTGISDGQGWTVSTGCYQPVGPCESVLQVELSNIGSCICTDGYSIRPNINNINWGGINGPTCNAASQSMEVHFYIAGSGCTNSATVTVSVNQLPVVPVDITGDSQVCAGSTAALADATSGGSWSSADPAIAAAGTSGVITGMSAGTATISYTMANSCGSVAATKTITVNTLPAVDELAGVSAICEGSSITLTDGTIGGIWSCSNSLATVSAGVVTGVAAGRDTINYTVTNMCGATVAAGIVTINPLPVAGVITGASSVCVTADITLTDSAAGGTWMAGSGLATVLGGVVNGVAAGEVAISYVVTNTCGSATATKIITVNPTPFAGPVEGPSALCAGSSIVLSDTMAGGVWNTSGMHTTVTLAGLVTGLDAGMDTIWYYQPSACGALGAAMKVITVMLLPNVYAVSGGGGYCPGTAGAAIAINGSQTTAHYQLYNGEVPVGAPVPGTGTSLGFGLLSDTGTYSVSARNFSTGCSDIMAGTTRVYVDTIVIPDVAIYAKEEIPIGGVDTFVAIVTNGMPVLDYTWTVNNTVISWATTGTFITAGITLYENDVVACTIRSWGPCGEVVGTNSVTIHLHTVGTNNVVTAMSDLNIFPNPGKGLFTVKGFMGDKNDKEVRIEIVDMLGKTVYEHLVLTQNGNIDEQVSLGGHTANGIYLLRLRSGVANRVFQIIVER